jgi:hypothetical protein
MMGTGIGTVFSTRWGIFMLIYPTSGRGPYWVPYLVFSSSLKSWRPLLKSPCIMYDLYGGVQHVLCCGFSFVCLRLVYRMLSVSLDCSFLIAPPVSLTFICIYCWTCAHSEYARNICYCTINVPIKQRYYIYNYLACCHKYGRCFSE